MAPPQQNGHDAPGAGTQFVSPALALLRRFAAGIAILIALYILSAPPFMIAMTRHNPREWPRIYEPLAAGFWCSWTRPIFVWYFDDLWKADTEIRGE
jgi:hypothetical protein